MQYALSKITRARGKLGGQHGQRSRLRISFADPPFHHCHLTYMIEETRGAHPQPRPVSRVKQMREGRITASTDIGPTDISIPCQTLLD